ncbi:MAG: deoxyribose-phosphate aldolase [Peptococcaceae bacterium]|nr:deoxyribose-phosphate aldolase [Peptococcaceae bacterium]
MKDIIAKIDHTNLNPTATEAEILAFAEAAQGTGVASLCVAPCFVETLVKHFPGGIPVCTVIGFPNGYEPPEVKAYSVEVAFGHGAAEVDYVVPLGRIKAGEYGHVYHDIQQALYYKPIQGVFKVILETGALSDAEIVNTINVLNGLPIDFYKTSTGFKYPGASEHAAALIMQHKRADIQMKVSGGIASIEDAERYIALGASRLGASRLLKACLDAIES